MAKIRVPAEIVFIFVPDVGGGGAATFELSDSFPCLPGVLTGMFLDGVSASTATLSFTAKTFTVTANASRTDTFGVSPVAECTVA